MKTQSISTMLLCVPLVFMALSARTDIAQAQDRSDLARPVNNIATSSGKWAGNRTATSLQIRLNGHTGTIHTTCAQKDFFHVQHIVRLPNKDGRAYFMQSQSNSRQDTDSSDGYILVFRTDPGVLDPKTDLLRDTPGTDGEYVYEEHYNAKTSKIGDWNHPGKMGRLGNVLLVAAQNWKAFCDSRRGESDDAVLFYNVSDPANPKYWGKIDASVLGQSEVAALGFFTIGNEWFLALQDKLFKAAEVAPDISNWTLLGDQNNPPIGQHGINFNSIEQNDFAPSPGTERVMYFDGTSDSDGTMSTESVQFLPGPTWDATPTSKTIIPTGKTEFNANLAGWCSSTGSLYVTNEREPAIYCAELRDPHDPMPGETERYNVVFQNHIPDPGLSAYNWSEDKIVNDYKTADHPALVKFGDKLYLAHLGTDGNHNLFVTSSSDGTTWSGETTVHDFKSQTGPALAVHKTKLFLAHRGTGGNKNIFITNSNNGTDWAAVDSVVGDFETESSPTLASFNGKLYLAHRGEGGNNNIFVTSSADGISWPSTEVTVHDFKTETGPALAAFAGKLYLAHRGVGGNKNIFITSSSDGVNWSSTDVVVADSKSVSGPALTVVGDRMYLAHRGTDGNTNLYITSTSDGEAWVHDSIVRDYKSSAGPALAGFGEGLALAHRGTGGNDNIFVTRSPPILSQ